MNTEIIFGEWIHRVVVGQMVDGKTVLVKGKPGRGLKGVRRKQGLRKT